MLLRYQGQVDYRDHNNNYRSLPIDLSAVEGRSEALKELQKTVEYIGMLPGGTKRLLCVIAKEKLGYKESELETTAALNLVDSDGRVVERPEWLEIEFGWPPLPY